MAARRNGRKYTTRGSFEIVVGPPDIPGAPNGKVESRFAPVSSLSDVRQIPEKPNRSNQVRSYPQRAYSGHGRDGRSAEAKRVLHQRKDPAGLFVRVLRPRNACHRPGVHPTRAPGFFRRARPSGNQTPGRGQPRPGGHDPVKRPVRRRRSSQRHKSDRAGSLEWPARRIHGLPCASRGRRRRGAGIGGRVSRRFFRKA